MKQREMTMEGYVDGMVKVFGAAGLTVGGLFFFVIFGTLMGGLAGWIVGLVFSDIILGIASQLGIHGVTMFQLGIFLGFVGGFLKTKVTAKVEAK
jgi:small-conductance mechanosensitive channel